MAINENYGVCQGCRRSGHVFDDCPYKVPCPWCKLAYVKCFAVVKNTMKKGKLFKCCSQKCGFWEWVKGGEMSGETSNESTLAGNSSTENATTGLENNVHCMFERMCRLTHEQDVEITVTIRKGNGNVECDKKGKRPA